MARPRKRHVQTSFAYKKLDKNGQHRGGARENAGRKPTGDFASHAVRPAIDKRHPQSVTLRVVPEVGWLRRLDTYAAVRHALRAVLPRSHEFRIVHLSVQNTHVHLIVEAKDKHALAERHARVPDLGREGDQHRVHAAAAGCRNVGAAACSRIATTPRTSARCARSATRCRTCSTTGAGTAWMTRSYALFEGRLDPYASGLAFTGWREVIPEDERSLPRDYEPPEVSTPRTWLLNMGWTRAKSISMFETPGPRKIRRVDA